MRARMSVSFYEMMWTKIKEKFPDLETEEAVANKLGIPVSTFRSHRTSTPTIPTIITIANNLNEDPVALLLAVVQNEGGAMNVS